ncbi:unnamed protein product [Ostreobium quekettii]|uniref:Uncharacterized protein n=1 Tax=Ostreobium quekettii TaxID=121088 RepID=A0A8S1IU81_9CHLO|nr:unnamed protein product [Ostreobium quekettii]
MFVGCVKQTLPIVLAAVLALGALHAPVNLRLPYLPAVPTFQALQADWSIATRLPGTTAVTLGARPIQGLAKRNLQFYVTGESQEAVQATHGLVGANGKTPKGQEKPYKDDFEGQSEIATHLH